MNEYVPLRLTQPDAINDGDVIECVTDDSIIFVQQHIKQPNIGIKTRIIEDGIFSIVELGNFLF